MQLKRFALILACVLMSGAGAGAAVWDNEMVLSPEDGWTSTTSPYNTGYNVAVDRWNRVHVVWCDNRKDGLWKTFYRRSTNGGITWEAEVQLTDPISLGMQAPRICVDTFGRVHVAYLSQVNDTSNLSLIFYIRSPDGGVTWDPPREVSTNPGYQPRDQVIAADGASRVHVAWTEDHYSGWLRDVYYRRSTDGGATWVDPVVKISNDPYGSFALCPSIAADLWDGVHISWHDSGNDPLAGIGAPLQGRKDPQLWGNFEIYYRRSTTGGASWTELVKRLTNAAQPSSGSCIAVDTRGWVHIAFHDERDGPPLRLPYFTEVYYVRSTNRGANWGTDTRLTFTDGQSAYPSITTDLIGRNHLIWLQGLWGQVPDVYYSLSPDGGDTWDTPYAAVSSSLGDDYASIAADPIGGIHLVWERWSDTYDEVYYRRARPEPILGLTEPSQGRHLVRDALNGYLHLVFHSNDNRVYYTQSTDNGATWAVPQYLGGGKYPTVCAFGGMTTGTIVCVAYKPNTDNNSLVYKWFDPGLGVWQTATLGTGTNSNPGPPSIVSNGYTVYIACRAYVSGSWRVYCKNFAYFNPSSPVTETVDSNSNPEQPCLAVDGNGAIYGAWKRGTQIWYAPRGTGAWGSKLRADQTTQLSQHPFVECYGDSVFVVWADWMPVPSAFDVWRASKRLNATSWYQRINVSNSSAASESPTQAWREFTTWAEGVGAATFDIKYWSPAWGTGTVEPTPDWSYWPQSRMWFSSWTELANAWSEKKNLGGTDYYWVLTKHQTYGFVGEQGGLYYSATAGDSEPSLYCQKRDGVIRYGSMAVDFARDSLVYEMPYLDPQYDYFLKVSSYRESGSDWTQALSVDGGPSRAVRFAPNRVDTAWIPIPLDLYREDRKVAFTLRNVRGDYVTSLGLTLYQRDPRRGKGGPQAGEPVAVPVKDVFSVYPNPMKAQAQIEYTLKAPAEVNLSVYDIMGRLVQTVIQGKHPAGLHRAYWEGKTQSGEPVAKGVYLLRLQTPSQTKTAKIVVIR